MVVIDVRPSLIESGYEEKPFDVAKALLEGAGYDIISLKQFADLRIAQGKGSHAADYGDYTREGFLYVPQRGMFLVRNSPIMTNAKEATECHRSRKEFYLTPEQVDEAMGKDGVDSVRFKSSKAIPFRRFGEDERTVFAFEDSAQKYGDFLEEAHIGTCISEMPIYLAIVENKPFAKQAWLRGLSGGGRSGLGGNDRGIYCVNSVRGWRSFDLKSVGTNKDANGMQHTIEYRPEVMGCDL